MEEKRVSSRSKRHSKAPDEGYWDCSVCTYRNSPEAYKCEMCDVRKGTSTRSLGQVLQAQKTIWERRASPKLMGSIHSRKPRLNAQLVAQQVAQQFAPPPKKEKSNIINKKEKNNSNSSKKGNRTILKQLSHFLFEWINMKDPYMCQTAQLWGKVSLLQNGTGSSGILVSDIWVLS